MIGTQMLARDWRRGVQVATAAKSAAKETMKEYAQGGGRAARVAMETVACKRVEVSPCNSDSTALSERRDRHS